MTTTRQSHIRPITVAAGSILAAMLCSSSNADVTLSLTKSFVEKYRNRATITDHCHVDAAPARPHAAKVDGDMHVAVRCDEAQFVGVSEIVNARTEPTAMRRARDAVDAEPVDIVGALRFWPEHASRDPFVQGDAEALETKVDTTNPPHIFEIHPVLSFDGVSVGKDWHDIAGYAPKDARDAFTAYENVSSHISIDGDKVVMQIGMVGDNYVKFQMTMTEKPIRSGEPGSPDGFMGLALVSDLEGDPIANKRRMIFVDGSPPASAAATLKKGDCRVVLGIPRIDLALVNYRVDHATDRPGVLDWSLPYEIIVMGMYRDACVKD